MSSTVTIQQNLGLERSRYSNQSDKSPLISDLIKAISDDKALTIFNTVALNAGKTDLLIIYPWFNSQAVLFKNGTAHETRIAGPEKWQILSH